MRLRCGERIEGSRIVRILAGGDGVGIALTDDLDEHAVEAGELPGWRVQALGVRPPG
jgi:hypothetical protein